MAGALDALRQSAGAQAGGIGVTARSPSCGGEPSRAEAELEKARRVIEV
jgi:hypothetical protein